MFITFFSLKNLQAAVSIFHSFYLLLLHTIKPWECMRRRTKEGSSRSFPRMCYVKGTAVATTENKDERMHGRTHVHSLLGATRRKNPFACGFCRSVAAKNGLVTTCVGRTKTRDCYVWHRSFLLHLLQSRRVVCLSHIPAAFNPSENQTATLDDMMMMTGARELQLQPLSSVLHALCGQE